MENSTFGQVVRELREASGFGSRELSRLVGMTDTYISQLERGVIKKPDYFNALSILMRLSNNMEKNRQILKKFNISPSNNNFRNSFMHGLYKVDTDQNFLSWMEPEIDELRGSVELITASLIAIVERDYSRAKIIIKKLLDFLCGDKDLFDLFINILSIDFSHLAQVERNKIIQLIQSNINLRN